MGRYRFLILALCQVGCGGESAEDEQSRPLSAADAGGAERPAALENSPSSEENLTDVEATSSAPEVAPTGVPETAAMTGLAPSETPPVTLPSASTKLDAGLSVAPEPVEADAGVGTETASDPVMAPLDPIVDNGGTLAWVVSAAGDGHDRSEDVAAFEDGSLLVTGLFGNSNPDIVFGQGEANETTLSAHHSVGDMFIARFNADGSLAFAKNHNLTLPNTRRSIVPLGDGSFVISANYWGGTVFGQGEANQVATPEDEYGVFIAKHNADGTINWVTRVTGAGAPSIAAVSDGFVVTGSFSETAAFGVGNGAETVLEVLPKDPPPDPEDPMAALEDDTNHFIAKFTSDGIVEWVKRTGGSYWNEYRDIAVLPNDSIVLTGTMDDTAVFGADEDGETRLISEGENDVFVAKYQPDGSLEWATRAGGVGYDGGISISCLQDESVVVVGHYSGPTVFGPGEPNETTLDESAGRAFMAKYAPDGTLAFARTLSGADVMRAASLEDGTTLVTGTFTATATFGAGEANETTLTATERDIFIAKYVPDGRLAWVKQVVGLDLWNEGRGIALLGDAVFIAGFFSERATFAPGEPEETAIVDQGMDDMFVAKYQL